MPDRPDSPADRLDAHLDSTPPDDRDDDLATFAERVIELGSLSDGHASEPSQVQIDRIRERVFAADRGRKGNVVMAASTFSDNRPGTTTARIHIRDHQEDRRPVSPLSMMMTAALVAIVAIAAFGVHRASLDFLPGGSDSGPDRSPGLTASPEIDDGRLDACNLTEHVSIFDRAVPNVAGLETAMRLDSDGDLVLFCNGEDIEVATAVRDVAPMRWPGVIAMAFDDHTARLLNLTNGATLDLDATTVLTKDGDFDVAGAFHYSGGAEPWLVTSLDENRESWQIIDLRSMETLALPEGTVPPDTEPAFEMVTGTDVAVITWRSEQYLSQPATPFSGGRQFTPEQRALVLPGSIGDHRWIDVVEYREHTTRRGLGFSQPFAISPDGNLLAYTTNSEGSPVIRIERATDGTPVADVNLNSLDRHTRFFITEGEPRLTVSDGEIIRIHHLRDGVPELLSEQPVVSAWWFYPTSDPDTILVSHNVAGTSVTPLDVASGEMQERYPYVAPIAMQVYGDDQLPITIVRVVPDESDAARSHVQLVNPATGEVVLESDPVAAHPVQITSFHTSLRNEGTAALVPIGYNRAVVLDAVSGETWQIEAPVDDDRLWRFSLAPDGSLIVAWPEPAAGTRDYVDGHVAPFEPGAEWIPLEGEPSGNQVPDAEGTPAT